MFQITDGCMEILVARLDCSLACSRAAGPRGVHKNTTMSASVSVGGGEGEGGFGGALLSFLCD